MINGVMNLPVEANVMREKILASLREPFVSFVPSWETHQVSSYI